MSRTAASSVGWSTFEQNGAIGGDGSNMQKKTISFWAAEAAVLGGNGGKPFGGPFVGGGGGGGASGNGGAGDSD